MTGIEESVKRSRLQELEFVSVETAGDTDFAQYGMREYYFPVKQINYVSSHWQARQV